MKPKGIKKRKIAGIAAICVFLLAVTAFSYHLLTTPPKGATPSIATHQPAATQMQPRDQAAQDTSARTDGDNGRSLEDRLVTELRKFYGDTIHEKHTQVILLKVKKFLLNLYPEDGEARFHAILKRAFPELADEIIKTLEKLAAYNSWLAENEQLLSGMTALERKGRLWEKRNALFGDDAAEIWSEEALAYEKRKQEMRDTIGLLNGSDDITIDEKLEIYKSTLENTYKDSPEAYILQNKDMLSKVFFGIDSVQKELAVLDPVHRQMEINQIRSEMGYTREQIDKLAETDAYREARWKNGHAYMQEREQIERAYEGDEREQMLKSLREKYFKHEANTIALEEKDGFFRYERPRVYGRN